MKYYDRGFKGYNQYRFRRHVISIIPIVNRERGFEMGLGFSYVDLNIDQLGVVYPDPWPFSDS